MVFRIISVGKIREPFFVEGIKEYLKRLNSYTRIELVDGLEEKISPRAGDKEVEKALDHEAERILALIGKEEMLIAMDAGGVNPNSEELAAWIENWQQSPAKRINFVIGSANGLSQKVKQRADQSISLSRMTLPHQMAVLVLTEQIYRGFKIIKGEPYHK